MKGWHFESGDASNSSLPSRIFFRDHCVPGGVARLKLLGVFLLCPTKGPTVCQMGGKPEVTVFFEPETHTVCSVVKDPSSRKVAVVDSVMGFDFSSGSPSTEHADSVIDFIQKNSLEVQWILETHAHADHLSAAPYIQEKLGGQIAIGEHIRHVQDVFAGVFNLGPDFQKDGSQFDKLFADGETFQIGELNASVMYTPGHTPACVCYLVGDALFTGDTLFMPDYGTARCDFPGGSSTKLYESIQKLVGGLEHFLFFHILGIYNHPN